MNSRLLSSGNSDEAEGPNKQANSLIEIEREQSSETCGVHATLGGVLLYMGYIGMCTPKGMVFQPFWS